MGDVRESQDLKFLKEIFLDHGNSFQNKDQAPLKDQSNFSKITIWEPRGTFSAITTNFW